jgi:hypothetical protein
MIFGDELQSVNSGGAGGFDVALAGSLSHSLRKLMVAIEKPKETG